MGACGMNGAAIHNNNAVGILYGSDTLRNNNRCNIVQILTEGMTNPAVGSSVNGTGAVIQDDNFWIF